MKFPELETKRLKLVNVTHKYTQAFFEIRSREDVTRYDGMNRLSRVDQAFNLIQSFHMEFESKKGIRWGVIVKETGRFVGSVGLNNINKTNKRAEVGFELHPSYWNRGIALEAVKEVLHYAYEKINMNRIAAITFPQNKSSIVLLERLGFVHECMLRGYIYQNNQPQDVFIYSLLKSDWK